LPRAQNYYILPQIVRRCFINVNQRIDLENQRIDLEALLAEQARERLERIASQYDFLKFPRRGEERYEALKGWVIQHCKVPASIPDGKALQRKWITDPCSRDNDRTYPVSVYVPVERQNRQEHWDSVVDRRRKARKAREPYFKTSKDYESPLLLGDLNRLLAELHQRLHSGQHDGGISRESTKISIELGKRRPAHICESDICLALFIHDRSLPEDIRSTVHAKPELYRGVVAPYFKDRTAGSELPFDWAKDRLAVVIGLAQTLIGSDYSFQAAEHSYKQVARIVANLRPEEHNAKHEFNLTSSGIELLDQLGPECLPEVAYLILKLQEKIELDILQTQQFVEFVRQLPQYLDRGLNIQRVVELFFDLIETRQPAQQSFEYALKLTSQVFSFDSAPWWFHENQSFIPQPKPNDWGSPASLEAHLALAQAVGPHYQYAKNIWEKKGREVLSLSEVDLPCAIALTGTIAEAYGVGNEQRACNIFSFAIDAIKEAGSGGQKRTIHLLCEMFKRHRPKTDIIGALEGPDVTFAMPGLLELPQNQGDRANIPNLRGNNFTPREVREIVHAASAPLGERAKITPANRLNHQPPIVLITAVGLANAHRLHAPQDDSCAGQSITPLLTWMHYDGRLAMEVPAGDQDFVSELYLKFFANKMPQPFDPPPGFLAFLNVFRKLRDPGWQPSFMFHPQDRERVEDQHAINYMDRLSVLCSWLDTAVLGLQTFDEVMQTFRWLILEQANPINSEFEPSEEIKQLQVEAAWEELGRLDGQERQEASEQFRQQRSEEEHENRLRIELSNLGDEELRIVSSIIAAQERIKKHQDKIEHFQDRLSECHERSQVFEDHPEYHHDPRLWRKIGQIAEAVQKLENELNSARIYLQGERSKLRHIQEELVKVRLKITQKKASLARVGDDLADLLQREKLEDENGGGYPTTLLRPYFLTAFYDSDLEFEDPYQKEVQEDNHKTDNHLDRIHEVGNFERALSEEKNRRFHQLARSVAYLSCLSACAAGEVCSLPDLRSIVLTLSRAMRDGSLACSEISARGVPNFKEATEAFRAMKRSGILKPEMISSSVGHLDSAQQLFRAMEDLIKMLEAFKAARRIIDMELRKGSEVSSQGLYLAAINDNLGREVKGLFDKVPQFFTSDAAQRMLQKFFWLERYQILLPHVQAFDNHEFPELFGGEGPMAIGQTLRQGMRLSLIGVMFAVASEELRRSGRHPFLQAAPPEDITSRPASCSDGSSDQHSLLSSSNLAETSTPGLSTSHYDGPLILGDNGARFVPYHVSRNLKARMREIREQVIQCRLQDFGLLANGGKVHIIHEIDECRLEFLKGHFGLTGTAFMVDNAKHLLTFPPTASAEEISLIASFLCAEGIIDLECPEIQMCIAGRLPPGDCAILGSSIMLLSNVNVPFGEDSFKTTQNEQTGYRMMIYDAGGGRNSFPFDIARDRGRTDMLGRRDVEDFILYQRVGSALSYAREGVNFNPTIKPKHHLQFCYLADRYKREYKRVLSRHGLLSILRELWLNPVHLNCSSPATMRFANSQAGRESRERHFRRAIKPVMDAWDNSEELSNRAGYPNGIRAEVQRVYLRLQEGIGELQRDMLEDPFYEKHRRALFNLEP
jgi:hypothetical protein